MKACSRDKATGQLVLVAVMAFGTVRVLSIYPQGPLTPHSTMAGFKTHITVSSTLGVAYAGVAFTQFHVPLGTCVLAGGLCGVSGMLPDLDSDSGIPLRESVAFAAAVVPMLMLERFNQLGFTPEMTVLAGALVYLLIRFMLAAMLKKFTVHRGMFHSIPAMIIAGEVAFLICCSDNMNLRYYKAGAVVAGFFSHLLLDELYSIEWYRGRIRLKKSFGTAIKFWSKNTWANISTYAKLAVLTFIVVNDPVWMHQFHPHPGEDKDVVPEMAADAVPELAVDWVEKILR